MGIVMSLDTARPKTLNRRYKNHAFVVTFRPEDRTWAWSVTYVETTVYTGEPKADMSKAIRAAEKHIDRTLELRGVG